MNVTSNKRLLALDVMRGITIAGMILVNNPGSWGYVYFPLKHAQWNGLTPTDLIFPFFMFIMGISTYISFRKYNFTFSTPRCPENYQKNDCHFPYRDSHQLVCLALLLSRPASLCPNPGSGSDATACPLLRSIRINCLAY